MEMERILEDTEHQQPQTTVDDQTTDSAYDLLRVDFRQVHGPAVAPPLAAPVEEEGDPAPADGSLDFAKQMDRRIGRTS
eukprot:9217695-Pyramimonas_sp.AAC.1